jgi:hypothetical protein
MLTFNVRTLPLLRNRHGNQPPHTLCDLCMLKSMMTFVSCFTMSKGHGWEHSQNVGLGLAITPYFVNATT